MAINILDAPQVNSATAEALAPVFDAVHALIQNRSEVDALSVVTDIASNSDSRISDGTRETVLDQTIAEVTPVALAIVRNLLYRANGETPDLIAALRKAAQYVACNDEAVAYIKNKAETANSVISKITWEDAVRAIEDIA